VSEGRTSLPFVCFLSVLCHSSPQDTWEEKVVAGPFLRGRRWGRKEWPCFVTSKLILVPDLGERISHTRCATETGNKKSLFTNSKAIFSIQNHMTYEESGKVSTTHKERQSTDTKQAGPQGGSSAQTFSSHGSHTFKN
jgi:hypothetical protein